MEGTDVQSPVHQENASLVTQKKRRRRRYARKPKSTNPNSEVSVTPDTNIANEFASSISPNVLEISIEQQKVRKRQRYFKDRSGVEGNKIQSNSFNSFESIEVKKTSVNCSFSNNISRSYMDKMKREDDTKSRETVAEREARRLAKQKVQDKGRNLANTSPTKSVHKKNAVVEKKLELKPVVTESVKVDKVESKSELKIDKTREEILAERELKKQAKLLKKNKSDIATSPSETEKSDKVDIKSEGKSDKSREEILAERELKKQAKLANKIKPTDVVAPTSDSASTTQTITKKFENVSITEKPVLSKAERREKQEAQRAAKAKMLSEKAQKTTVQSTDKKSKDDKVEKTNEITPPAKKIISLKISQHKVKLFNHLYADKGPGNILNSNAIHPAIVKLGAQYANGNIVGSNARCIAFMERIKKVIEDYNTPSQKEFGRGLEAILHPCVNYLHQCRPLSVSITNALKFIKWQISQLPANQTDAEMKEHLLESVDTYVRDQIEKAAQAISIFVQEKISNGDVILTFGCSSLICHIIEEAQKRKVDFSVIVVDSRPHHEGQEMLRRLVAHKIRCTFVLINAIGFVMPEVTKVLLGANALLANGYVMSRAGTAQVALMAKFYNVPVLVCCETHKFSERVQTDAFVFNEIGTQVNEFELKVYGDPQDLVLKTGKHTTNEMQNWKSIPQLTPLNLRYDITPPELVAAVVTEIAILPCTSVPVILRIKPSEIGY